MSASIAPPKCELCLDCHKDVAKDVHGKAGFHGRIREPVCRTCHTEHKGRGAKS